MKYTLKIHGMHCASCEVLMERRLKKYPGVTRVSLDYATGEGFIECSEKPDINALQNLVGSGYKISQINVQKESFARHITEIGAIIIILLAAYFLLKQFSIIPEVALPESVSFGLALVLGMIAATSTCLAVSGGLLLAIATRYAEANPGLTRKEKFKPHIFFNIGRIASYTLFGVLLGWIGSFFAFSARASGIVTIIAGIVMVLLGLQMLRFLPFLQRIRVRMPKFIAHKLYDQSGKQYRPWAPFAFGASTFFLPCGFTQALQFYVIAQGSALHGGLIMLAFSLGTAPALLSLGALTSYTKGTTYKYITKTAAVLVIILGIFGMQAGLNLSGATARADVTDLGANIVNGKQYIQMTVRGYEYEPSTFTVKEGVPVVWQIDGRQAAGCARVITVPGQGLTQYLRSDGITEIEFTPKAEGKLAFSCTMGMTTPGAAFTVVKNDVPLTGEAAIAKDVQTCDPTIADCPETQKITLSVTRAAGFFPRDFTVKAGAPVEMTINAEITPGGCMSTLVIPKYNIAHRMTVGTTSFTFTPTEKGTFPIMCSMGSRWGTLTVL